MVKIAVVVAAAENGVIGRENQLPWRISADLKYFKKITMGHPIVMGRKTFESIGKPLPGRSNFVITRSRDWFCDGVTVCSSIDDAIEKASVKASNDKVDRLMIIGGAEIYKQVLPITQYVYLTKVHADVSGDAFFPSLNLDEWQVIHTDKHPKTAECQYEYSFIQMEKRN